MKRNWTKTAKISAVVCVLVVVALLVTLIFPSGTPVAYAAEISIPGYATDSWMEQNKYSKYPTLTTQLITIPEQPGMKIKQAVVKEKDYSNGQLGKNVLEIADAVGKTSWSGSLTLPGIEQKLRSEENTSGRRYYTWYRYGIGTDPEGWWHSIITAMDNYGNVYTDNLKCKSTEKDEWGLPKYPGCSYDQLALIGTVTNSFRPVKENGEVDYANYAAFNVVNVSGAKATATLNDEAIVSGPNSSYYNKEYYGQTWENTEPGNIIKVEEVSGKIVFTVQYKQNFNALPAKTAWDDLPAPGARVATYYAAFIVDVEAHTYRYPYVVYVEYENDKPAPPTGDFDIVPSTIKYGESFQLVPKNFKIDPRCTYEGHIFTMKQGSTTWTSPLQTSQTAPLAFNGSNSYPPPVQVGQVEVSMQIRTSCGNSEWVTKTLTVLDPKISGDFDILPDKIKMGDPFELVPKNFQIDPVCTYQGHIFTMKQGTTTWTSPLQTSQTTSLKFNGQDEYPPPVQIGQVEVSMQIRTNCGNSEWVTKYLTVIDPVPKPTGDFDIVPSTINYRDPVKLVPRDFVIDNRCTYNGHIFVLEHGTSWTSPLQTSQTQQLAFSYPDYYPSPIKVGTVTVKMQIRTSCGNSDWVTKTLTVNPFGKNEGPIFKLGWFYNGDYTSKTPVTQVVQGTTLMVRLIEDPDAIPPIPSDPEGDPFSLTGWDFNSSTDFVKGLPSKYGFTQTQPELTGIVMDTLGKHRVGATLTDIFGASNTEYSNIVEVIPPNPVPVCRLEPNAIKSGRPYPEAGFDSSGSYSPLGRSIVEVQWGNKKPVYTNPGTEPIYETITLSVKDSAGLWSLQPANCQLRINPDLPPVAKADVPPLAIRGQDVVIYNKSYSPDGDAIVSVQYRVKYDRNNNGFADDPWEIVSGTPDKLVFTPTKVGKYLFYVQVQEEYGQWDDTLSEPELFMMMNVINLPPSVSFKVEGSDKEPDNSQPVTHAPSTIRNNWSLYQTNSTTTMSWNKWQLVDNKLSAGSGIGSQRLNFGYNTLVNYYTPESGIYAQGLADNGLGANNLSPWKPYSSLSYAGPLLVTTDPNWNATKQTDKWIPLNKLVNSQYGYDPIPIRANPKYIYFYDHIEGTYDGYYDDYWERDEGDSDEQNDLLDMNIPTLYYLNKSKLYANGIEEIPYLSGGFLRIDYNWTNGHPYDHAIRFNQIEKPTFTMKVWNSFDDYYGGWSYAYTQQVEPHSAKILAYELAERTLYVAVEWEYVEELVDERARVMRRETQVEWFTFDALSGELIARRMDLPDNPAQSRLIPQGEHLIYLHHSQSATIYDRQLNVVRTGSLDAALQTASVKNYTPPNGTIKACTLYTSDMQKGVQGELYRYESASCGYQYYAGGPVNGEQWMGTYVVKYNPDLTVAWMAPTVFRYTKEADTWAGNFLPEQMRNAEGLLIDPISNRVLALSMQTNLPNNDTLYAIQTINMTTGQSTILAQFDYNNRHNPYNYLWYPGMERALNWNGELMAGSTITRDNRVSPITANFPIYRGINLSYADYPLRKEWYGDGIAIGYQTEPGTNKVHLHYALYVGQPAGTADVAKPFSSGQFMSPNSLADAEISFTLTMEEPLLDQELVGFSFRMANARNRYAVETDGRTLYLSKYVNGVRTVLASINYPFQSKVNYGFKIRAVGDKLEVYLNNVPYLSATDGTYTSGRFGPFTDKPYVAFSGMTTKEVKAPTTFWTENYAIWEEGEARADIRYSNITYEDPENDPMAGDYTWRYVHTPKFLNNQGLSALNGKTFTSAQTVFDKVGEYWVTLMARDDPYPELQYRYPNMVFDEYRQNSNEFMQKVIVHRRPVAQFTLTVNADGSVSWNDQSYDPDRWLSPTQYSPPDVTGINYQITRGILERKYSYITPSGTTVNEKLTQVTERGAYQVTLQVKDEYGAWSYPVTVTLEVPFDPPPAPVNNKPIAQLVTPNGTAASPQLVYSTRPTITWNQSDPDGHRLVSYNVVVTKADGTPVIGSGQQTQNMASGTQQSWTVSMDLERGEVYKVMVQVEDERGALSNWSEARYMIINSKPSVTITEPNGVKTAPTLILNDLRPTFTWTQTDPERNYFARFALEVAKADGTVVYSTTQDQNTTSTTRSFRVTQDLPAGELLQARMRVTDDDPNLWSDDSNTVWFILNRSPSATIDYPTGTQASPTAVNLLPTLRFSFNDPDPNAEFSKYRIRVRSENGATVYVDETIAYSSSETSGVYEVKTPLPRGVKLQVDIKVWDQYGAESAWSAPKWMIVNRAPSATILYPDGSQANPTILPTEPLVQFRFSDPDPNTFFMSYRLQILSEDGTEVYLDRTEGYLDYNPNGSYQVEDPLPRGEKLQVRIKVWDDFGEESEWSTSKWFVLNGPPSVVITYPDGTQANPTMVSGQPTISFTFHDPDPNTVYSQYRILIRSENGLQTYVDRTITHNSHVPYGTYTVTDPLPTGQKLQILMKVWDQYGAESDWSEARWIMTNRPPVANFDWTPKPVWEGDTVQLINLSSDPDGDPLSYQWRIEHPNGDVTTATNKDPVITNVMPGTYQITLTATDPFGLSHTVTKQITVYELTVTGQVRHTVEWDANRKAYNKKVSGDEESPRKYNVFFAGERFVLIAQTTDTQTATRATAVQVSMKSFKVNLTSTDSINWSGEMYDPSFDKLQDGPLTFTFTATYSNGVVKTDEVEVIISDPWTEYYREHRIK